MGLLEDWDRRNQRTAEWQLHAGQERGRGRRLSWRTIVAIAASVALLRLTLSSFLPSHWTFAILVAVALGCLAVEIVRARRARRAWEASRPQEPAERA